MNAVYSRWKLFPDVISGLDAGHSWAMVNLPFLPRSGQKSKWKMWNQESLVSIWGWWRWWRWGGGGGGSSMLPRLATRVSQVLSHESVSRKWDRTVWVLSRQWFQTYPNITWCCSPGWGWEGGSGRSVAYSWKRYDKKPIFLTCDIKLHWAGVHVIEY